jgi:hypothetical protein
MAVAPAAPKAMRIEAAIEARLEQNMNIEP